MTHLWKEARGFPGVSVNFLLHTLPWRPLGAKEGSMVVNHREGNVHFLHVYTPRGGVPWLWSKEVWVYMKAWCVAMGTPALTTL